MRLAIFHKQDYEALVDLVGRLAKHPHLIDANKVLLMMDDVADFANDYAALDRNGNRNFKRERFIAACRRRLDERN